MEHTEVTPVTSVNANDDTPTLHEVSPNPRDETIVEVDVTGLPKDEKPSVLEPSTDDLEETPTLPKDVKKAVIYDISKLRMNIISKLFNI